MSDFIPNSFQIPNAYVDRFMAHLTPEEFVVMSYLVRRIFGFQKRQDRVALSQFCEGVCSRDGKQLDSGTGLSEPVVRKCLESLVKARLVIRVEENKSGNNEGTLWELQLDDSKVNLDWLKERKNQKKRLNITRTRKALSVKMSTPLCPTTPPPLCPTTPPPSCPTTPPPLMSDNTPPLMSDNTPPLMSDNTPPLMSDNTHNNQLLNTVLNPVLKTDMGAQSAPSQSPQKKGDWLDCLQKYQPPENHIDVDAYPIDVQDTITEFCRLWGMKPPQKSTKKGGEFALWIDDARNLVKACGEHGLVLLERVHDDWSAGSVNDRPPYTVTRPGSLIKIARAKAGEVRLKNAKAPAQPAAEDDYPAWKAFYDANPSNESYAAMQRSAKLYREKRKGG